ncbi:MAG: AMP-binding protein, partial [Actinobacteria bacterium]|nr:AMP-binding protein [Actinomycetota bacterium]
MLASHGKGTDMLQGRTLWELMERRVDETPDALLAVDEDMRTLTFAELWSEGERTAAGLMASGVGAGDHVSWQLPTWIESLVLVVALSRLGAVQNPLLPILREREVGFATDQTDARLLVVPSTWRDHDFESMATGIAERQGRGMRVLVADRALPQGDPSSLPDLPSAIDPADQPVRWVFYTSGTTADPKGAQHTDGTIAAAASAMAGRLAVISADRAALVFPFTHIGGIVWLLTSLQTGCGLILTESFDPRTTPEVLSREGVTLAGAGTVFHQAYIAEQRRHVYPVFPNVRAFPGGGAPKPPGIVEEVRALFDVPVLSGYGLTEAPILTMADVTDSDTELATSEGRPVQGVELRIVGIDGQAVVPGSEGEIRVRAPQLMLGYLDPFADM